MPWRFRSPTVLGYLAGMQLPEFLRAFDHWVALVLLCGIGGKMLWENFTDQPEKMAARDPTRGMTLIVLSIATSIDALAVGLGLALIDVSIWRASGSIGVITFLLSAIGIRFGGKLGVRWEHRAEILGAMVLIAIGLRIFISHGMDHGFGAH
jgi:putative Mn2+ efflux pump MntP